MSNFKGLTESLMQIAKVKYQILKDTRKVIKKSVKKSKEIDQKFCKIT